MGKLGMDADVIVAVPRLEITKVYLRDAHAALHHAQRHQTAAAEFVIAVASHGCRGLLAEVEYIRRFRLHAERDFHGGDAGFQLRLMSYAIHIGAIQFTHQRKLPFLISRAETAVADVLQQLPRLFLSTGDIGTLVHRWQEGGVPKLRAQHRITGTQHDEARQVLVLRPQPIREPGAERRPARQSVPAIHHEQRRPVIPVVGVHRADDADVVDVRANLRKNLADLDAALSALLEFEWRAHQVPRRAVGFDLRTGHRLAIVLDQHGLGVESVHLRHAAVQKQKDDTFGFGRKMRLLHRQRRLALSAGQHIRQADHSKAGANPVQQISSSHLIHRAELARAEQRLRVLRPRAAALPEEVQS